MKKRKQNKHIYQYSQPQTSAVPLEGGLSSHNFSTLLVWPSPIHTFQERMEKDTHTNEDFVLSMRQIVNGSEMRTSKFFSATCMYVHKDDAISIITTHVYIIIYIVHPRSLCTHI